MTKQEVLGEIARTLEELDLNLDIGKDPVADIFVGNAE